MSTPAPLPTATSTHERLHQVLWRLAIVALLTLATFLSACGEEQTLEDTTVHEAAVADAHLDWTIARRGQ
jgi:hypothetical protein